MPTSNILTSIKANFKREDNDESESKPVAKDYANAPELSESGEKVDLNIVISYSLRGFSKFWYVYNVGLLSRRNIPTKKITSLEEYPLLPADVPISPTSTNPLDAQVEAASTRIVRNAEAEEIKDENALSDIQLRRLYDDEEIERFLTVFGTHVNEIILPPSNLNARPRKFRVMRSDSVDGRPGDIKVVPAEDGDDDSDAATDVDEPWTYLNTGEITNVPKTHMSVPEHPTHDSPRYLSARVATFLISKLPPPSANSPLTYEHGAARLVGQRIYFSMYPFYAPLVTDLMRLAAWSDWYRSARACIAWWVIWWFNWLLPTLLGVLFISLLRRGIIPSLSLGELRKRRKSAEEADKMGDTMEGTGAGVSFIGTGSKPGVGQGGGDISLWDTLKLTKIIGKAKGKKGKSKARQATGADMSDEEVGHLDGQGDWRKPMLKALEDFADLNERVQNLFMWRRAQSSRMYALLLGLLILFVALSSAQTLAKLSYAVVGFFYWFIIPIILATPSDVFKRVPLPLADVPSDAEYAMGLITARLALGESVIPAPHPSQHQFSRTHRRIIDRLNPATTSKKSTVHEKVSWTPGAGHTQDVEGMRKEADEKEAVAAEERATASGERSLMSEAAAAEQDTNPDLLSKNKGSEELAHGVGAPQTVSANHKATPGSLTISSEEITFTPLLANLPRRVVPLGQIQGVKKTHRHTSGLRIRYKVDEEMEREVVFRFVSNRDEIFGKLVGLGGK
ncbi:hypothetical protein FRC07_003697 [Ceratobasidium sp. 392]|nr:hypothetical protein FRC07_003697 [Ceratobasidium sp. 392]